jgi:DNA-binding CsgD family transcriptional regulator
MLLHTLELLFQIQAVELRPALMGAAEAVAGVFNADKVDIFIFQEDINSLVALGIFDSPLAQRQKALGMDRLQIANRGLAVEVFQSGQPEITGHADRDPREIPGVYDGLGVRSEIVTPLDVGGTRRGVVQIFSMQEDYFVPEEDLEFMVAVTRWIGILAQRAELMERRTSDAEQVGRREGVTHLLALLTPRQREIAELIADGLTNQEIATKLFLLPGSVGNHIKRIRERIGAVRRAQIAAWVVLDRSGSSSGN